MSFLNGLQHIGIPTEDFAASQKFYETLGFKLINSEDNQGSKVGFFELNNLVIEIWEAKSAGEVGAIHHIALDTDDIAGAYEWIKTLDFEMIDSSIQNLPFWEKGIQYFNFYGPNREIFEVCQINK